MGIDSVVLYVQGQTDSVSPARYDVTLRPGVPLNVTINVTTIRNLPLDLYILFDLSRSLSTAFGATQSVSARIR